MQFYYYNLAARPSDCIYGKGEKLDYNEAVEAFCGANPQEYALNKELLSLKSIEAVNPILHSNSEEWQKAFATAIFMISGCAPQRNDRANYKKIYSELLHASKKDAVLENLLQSRQFVFGCLPYLIAGFRTENKGWSTDGNNNIGNFIQTIRALDQGATISTFLCAHREKAPQMVDNIHLEAARKAMNLILGIKKNFPNFTFSSKPLLKIFQPDASVLGVGAVFPEIFLTYLNNGKLGELILLLQKHYIELKNLIRMEYGAEVALTDLKLHRCAIDEYSVEHFGENWKGLETLPRNKTKSHLETESFDDLINAIDTTADKVIRFMPYYERGLSISRELLETNKAIAEQYANELPNIAELIEASTADFAKIRTVVSKAIYETVFYCVWGKNARANNEIILGLERDQYLHQSMGIAFGYNQGKLDYHNNHLVPAMYAKRSVGGNTRSVADLSFRQFWRLSEQAKFP